MSLLQRLQKALDYADANAKLAGGILRFVKRRQTEDTLEDGVLREKGIEFGVYLRELDLATRTALDWFSEGREHIPRLTIPVIDQSLDSLVQIHNELARQSQKLGLPVDGLTEEASSTSSKNQY